MRENESTKVLDLFKLDINTYNSIKGKFGFILDDDPQILVALDTLADQYQQDRDQALDRSYGLGLGLSRLIARSMGGSTGLEIQNSTARFWIAVKIPAALLAESIV